ncbi:MAG: succinate dehydrogenase/fumarate reductase iron-sulfur subunit [Methanococci archaeon]|nr:succinate dehydrogenase/fumarate reductase iron-sulfur subunit [Methanococci archaeon]
MVKITIKRFDGIKSYFESYNVPENITVLEALDYINKKFGANILFRYSCRNGQCGSCALTINGEPKLACETKVEEGMIIEPLKGFNVVKDLVVDREQYYKKLTGIKNHLIREKFPENLERIPQEVVEKNKDLRGCIDCLSCLSLCPSRDVSEYPGATFMRQLARFAFDVRDEEDRERIAFFENIYNCTTCAKCVEVCPKEIDIVHRAIEQLRHLAFSKGYRLDSHLKVRENVLKYNRSVVEEKLPLLKQVSDFYPAEDEKLKVAFFTGCLVDFRLQDVGKEAIKVLNAHGISVVIPKTQVCCGSPFFRTGQRDVAEKLKEKNLKIFDNLDVDYVITICAGCGSTLKNDYKERNFEVRDITEVLTEVGLLNYKPIKMRITYHDPCHLKRGQGIWKEPREILKSIPELEFIDMEARCCGAGGGVRSGKPEIADLIGKRRAKMIYDLKVDTVITVCPFCEYHIRDCLDKFRVETGDVKKSVDVMNIVSLLSKVI